MSSKTAMELTPSRWEAIAVQDRSFHLRQFEVPYRSSVKLADYLRRIAPGIRGQALDVGCGAGALIHYLGPLFATLEWTGVDIAGRVLFPESQKYFERAGFQPRLLTGDFTRLHELVEQRSYDLITCTQVVSCISGYDALLAQLLEAARGWVLISGLFSNFQVDAEITMTDYTWPEAIRSHHYNIYSLPRFREQCLRLGAAEVLAERFDIDIDLPVPENGGLGTYTERDAAGTRRQFSGPVHLPWHFVAIRMDDSRKGK